MVQARGIVVGINEGFGLMAQNPVEARSDASIRTGTERIDTLTRDQME